MHFSSCWRCKTIPMLDNLEMICPLHKRPLCIICANLQECAIMQIDWFFKNKRVEPSLQHTLQLPTFTHSRQHKAYVSDLCTILVPYAQQRRQVLLQLITEKGVKMQGNQIAFIGGFNFEHFYESFSVYRKKEIVALAGFCGRDAGREDLEQSFRAFTQEMKVK